MGGLAYCVCLDFCATLSADGWSRRTSTDTCQPGEFAGTRLWENGVLFTNQAT